MAEGCRISKEISQFEDSNSIGVTKWVKQHNFVEKLKVVVPKTSSNALKSTLNDLNIMQIECSTTLEMVLTFILGLESSLRKLVKFLPIGRDITHQNTFSIGNGTITIKLDEETYHRSGFKFKKSAFSQGNKRFVNQMFIHSFDLQTFGKTNDPNDMRLLWFASNIDSNVYQLAIAGESSDALDAILKSNLDVSTQNFDISFNFFDKCGVPSFEINEDEDDQNEIFQWLKYEGEEPAIIELDTSMDPYAVHFDEPIEVVNELDVEVLIIKSSSLIPSVIPLTLIEKLIASGSWFGLASFGHKHVLKSFGSKGEHGLKNDGSNDLFMFVNGLNSILWKIMDRSDPN